MKRWGLKVEIERLENIGWHKGSFETSADTLSSVTQDITIWGQSPRILDHSRPEAGQPSFGEGQWLDAGPRTSGHKAGGVSQGRTGPLSSMEWLAESLLLPTPRAEVFTFCHHSRCLSNPH